MPRGRRLSGGNEEEGSTSYSTLKVSWEGGHIALTWCLELLTELVYHKALLTKI